MAKWATITHTARAAQAAAEAICPGPSSGGQSVTGGQGWALPGSRWISSADGPRPNKPVAGVGAFHFGTDIAAGCGQGVHAASSGTVAYAGWLGSYGNRVLIHRGDGTQTGCAHNSSVLVTHGQQVSAGATVALVGTTGASSGCHVHCETRVNGARVNPQSVMSARGVTLG
ncbi:M23 family metallopeptidase [Cryobacterium roopkundense]|uniref:Murein DD-endopeptidase MepM/ murein hydrolase activator NlpD n=1 Tax=Cryobacterium roopkundense TaxID=1001240 RepID=A0A7W8ZW40_9MICO|nr:murein DD-endopeptidase MepM/ murein hydrolase activator NlpD [Cryobacterium roopkundense]